MAFVDLAPQSGQELRRGDACATALRGLHADLCVEHLEQVVAALGAGLLERNPPRAPRSTETMRWIEDIEVALASWVHAAVDPLESLRPSTGPGERQKLFALAEPLLSAPAVRAAVARGTPSRR